MRDYNKLEGSFATRLVTDVRAIVDSGLTHREVIAKLRAGATRHALRAYSLRRKRYRVSPGAPRQQRLIFLIRLRERASAYLRATAHYVSEHAAGAPTLRQMPRSFAVHPWYQRSFDPVRKATDEFPFMEFSS